MHTRNPCVFRFVHRRNPSMDGWTFHFIENVSAILFFALVSCLPYYSYLSIPSFFFFFLLDLGSTSTLSRTIFCPFERGTTTYEDRTSRARSVFCFSEGRYECEENEAGENPSPKEGVNRESEEKVIRRD